MIISASRRTDIPAFYSDWFINRLKEGYVLVRNPFNANQVSKINLTPDAIECIVFWTKNPNNLINKLSEIDRLGYRYYFQFTVTSYDTSIEKRVPSKKNVIKTFRELSDQIGSEKVVWRYDPILLTDKFNFKYHIKWYEYIAQELSGYTKKCMISFIDMYKKCERNMKDITLETIDADKKKFIAKRLSNIASKYNLSMESCAEVTLLEDVGVKPGKCIDDKLISKIINRNIVIEKDKAQRHECGCITSIDMGSYNTCKHGCKYCYANFSEKSVLKNCKSHDVESPLLIGSLTGDEQITERKMISYVSKQQSLFW